MDFTVASRVSECIENDLPERNWSLRLVSPSISITHLNRSALEITNSYPFFKTACSLYKIGDNEVSDQKWRRMIEAL